MAEMVQLHRRVLAATANHTVDSALPSGGSAVQPKVNDPDDATAFVVVAGDSGNAHAESDGVAIAGDEGSSSVVSHGIAAAGKRGKARGGASVISVVRHSGTASTGEGGVAISTMRGEAMAADHGIAIACREGVAAAGVGGVLVLGYINSATGKIDYRIACVGDNGIEPHVRYKLDEKHEFVRA